MKDLLNTITESLNGNLLDKKIGKIRKKYAFIKFHDLTGRVLIYEMDDIEKFMAEYDLDANSATKMAKVLSKLNMFESAAQDNYTVWLRIK